MKTIEGLVGPAPWRSLLLTAVAVLAFVGPAQARARHGHHRTPDPPPASTVRLATTSPGVQLVRADPSGYGGQLALAIGGSRILRFPEPIGRVLLGDPKIADVVPLSDRTLYVLGKTAGATSLTVMPASDAARPIAAMDLRVGFDVDALQRAYAQIMPGEPIRVSPEGDGLVLSGTLSSAVAAARAVALAEQYAPKKVVNLLAVRAPDQVMLQVQVAEVQRSALRQLGISQIGGQWANGARWIGSGSNSTGGTGTGAGGGGSASGAGATGGGSLAGSVITTTPDPNAVLNLLGGAAIGKYFTLQGLFSALENKGYASVLAEPTLVALSGETAVFFAGGEFPVPVPQISGVGGGSQITVEFKQYGVSVGFTPTVYGDTINLNVAPEVSALDKANGVVLDGFRIPGITTRRAKTTVELRDGQSFAIAGLINRDFSDSLSGVPGAANLPIFGALFRSTGFQHNETEVVIIVTVHLAKATERRKLLLPTDTAEAPSALQEFMTSAVDRPRNAPPTSSMPSQGASK